MGDKRGEYYASGFCEVSGEPCSYNLKGACGVCKIGGIYRRIIKDLSDDRTSESALKELTEG